METVGDCITGISWIMAGIVNYCSVCRLLEVKKHLWAQAGIFIASVLTSEMIIFIGDLANLPPTFVMFLLAVILFCEGSFLKRLTLGIMLSCAIFAGNGLADNYMNFMLGEYINFQYIMRLISAFLLYGSIRIVRPERRMELDPSMWKLLLLLAATPIGVVLSVVLMTKDEYNFWIKKASESYIVLQYYRDAYAQQMAVLLAIAMISFWGLLWAAVVLAKQKQLEDAAKYEEINRKYYEGMEQQHFEIRRMRHDMANYLQTLSVLPQKRRDSYIAELLKDKAVTSMKNWCGDVTVNAVMTLKEQVMQERGITLEYELEIPEPLPFRNVDICAILANALDNAIEACSGSAEKGQNTEDTEPDNRERRIILKAKMKKGMFMMSVKNPSGIQIHRGILPQSAKKDGANHGYGLKSIQEVVKRIDGRMELETENGWFELFVLLFAPSR